MEESNQRELEKRIVILEETVEELKFTVDKLQDRLASIRTSRTQASTSTFSTAQSNGDFEVIESDQKLKPAILADAETNKKPADRPKVSNRPFYSLQGGNWLNRVGISLLFISVILAFSYSLDQPWFTQDLRIGFGLVIGISSVIFGMTSYTNRPRVGQGLVGGGVAILYATGFTAFQIYELIPYGPSFAGFVLVTVFSFVLAVIRNDVPLAVIATLGGLATPFLLYEEGGTAIRLISYMTIILAGSCTIYWFKGWRSLLLISAIGSWLVLLVEMLPRLGGSQNIQTSEQIVLQIAIFINLGFFWVMPVIRGMKRAENPDRFPAPPPVRMVGYFFNHPALPLSLSTPLLAFVYSMLVWDLSNTLWGWIMLESAAILGFIYLFIRGKKLNHLAQVQGFTACILLVTSIFLIFDDYALLVALGASASLIRVISRTMSDRLLSLVSHVLFGYLAGLLVYRFFENPDRGIPLLNLEAICELAVIGLMVALAPIMKKRTTMHLYLLVAHVLFLGWLYHELHTLENGEAIVSAFWGIYCLILLVYGLRQNKKMVLNLGLGTLAVVVVKLLVVDMSEVNALVRVLLFLGFGIVLTALSYIMPNFLKPDEEEDPPHLEEMEEKEFADLP